jgi:hypothetical protein
MMGLQTDVASAEVRVIEHARALHLPKSELVRLRIGSSEDLKRIVRAVEVSEAKRNIDQTHKRMMISLLSNLEARAHYWIKKKRMRADVFDRYALIYLRSFCSFCSDENDDLIKKSRSSRSKRALIYRQIFK